jgi:hypothetical protein
VAQPDSCTTGPRRANRQPGPQSGGSPPSTTSASYVDEATPPAPEGESDRSPAVPASACWPPPPACAPFVDPFRQPSSAEPSSAHTDARRALVSQRPTNAARDRIVLLQLHPANPVHGAEA